jgi:hypothetical protein
MSIFFFQKKALDVKKISRVLFSKRTSSRRAPRGGSWRNWGPADCPAVSQAAKRAT